jgi:hypothetical protein
MATDNNFPLIESHFPDLMHFISALVQEYQSGEIDCWEIMENKVHAFFTTDEMDKVIAVAPYWRTMAAFANGATLVHVLSVFLALFLCPEFQQATKNEQDLLKWIVFFHDIAKEPKHGSRDFIHGFRSAAITGRLLPVLGFTASPEYRDNIDDWIAYIYDSIISEDASSVVFQDNQRLSGIIGGIERLFGYNTPPALIIKTILLHISINGVKEWPQASPLSESEELEYLDMDTIPLLKTMMLVDSCGWDLFEHTTREHHRLEILAVFRRIEHLAA